MAVSPALGELYETRLSAGPIRHRESGEGEPILFLHPMIVNGDIWRKIVPLLAPRYRCITPDLPLGGHEVGMEPGVDLCPPGVAAIVAELLAERDFRDVTVVGNDTGGAFAQIVAANHPERVARLVLVTCDAFDNFPPPAAKPLVWFSQVPGFPALARLLILRSHRLQRSPLAFGGLTKRPIEERYVRSYLEPSRNPGVLRDSRRALRGLAPRHTLDAAEKLRGWDRPALVVWSIEDRYFPVEHAHRLGELLNASVELIDDCYTFVSEDRPERLAELIDQFMTETAAK